MGDFARYDALHSAKGDPLRFEERYKKPLPPNTNAQEAAVRVYNSGGVLKRSDPFVGPKDRFGNSFKPTQWADPNATPIVAPQPAAIAPPVQKAPSKELIVQFRNKVLERGGSAGIQSLGRIFRLMDTDDNRRLGPEELGQALEHYGLYLPQDDIQKLMKVVDKDNSGNLTITEFLLAIRGKINERRQRMILMAYKVLDKDGSGCITIEDIQSAYNVNHDPDVLAGRLPADTALDNFLAQFDTIDRDGKVTQKEFTEYYRNISASIDNDDYFELMIRNAWHIPGGEGWCANTANVRLLVVSEDGAQRVVMIENDLGLDLHDREAVMAALASQGITDVAKYTLSGDI
jgi:Ca2+-binding EF-hand superfamily protein